MNYNKKQKSKSLIRKNHTILADPYVAYEAAQPKGTKENYHGKFAFLELANDKFGDISVLRRATSLIAREASQA